MPTDRRTVLGGVVTAAVVSLAGCSGERDDEPRPPRENRDGDGEQNTLQETAITRTVDALRPKVASWKEIENDDGNLTLVVELNNIHPRPVEGTMRATFASTDGEEEYTRSFTLAEDGKEVTMELPIGFERYNTNMSLPDFTFENVTER